MGVEGDRHADMLTQLAPMPMPQGKLRNRTMIRERANSALPIGEFFRISRMNCLSEEQYPSKVASNAQFIAQI
jgi:hypothetical protein